MSLSLSDISSILTLLQQLLLKIQSQRKIPYRLTVKEAAHRPAGVYPQEVPQQSASQPKAIATGKRPQTLTSKNNLYCLSLINIGHVGAF